MLLTNNNLSNRIWLVATFHSSNWHLNRVNDANRQLLFCTSTPPKSAMALSAHSKINCHFLQVWSCALEVFTVLVSWLCGSIWFPICCLQERRSESGLRNCCRQQRVAVATVTNIIIMANTSKGPLWDPTVYTAKCWSLCQGSKPWQSIKVDRCRHPERCVCKFHIP